MIEYRLNTKFPSLISDIKDIDGISIKNEKLSPNIKIGEKYYGVFDGKCIAFKVISISFGRVNVKGSHNFIHTEFYDAYATEDSNIFCELNLADGRHIFYSLLDLSLTAKFHTKEDYFEYVKTRNQQCKIEDVYLIETSYFQEIKRVFANNIGYMTNDIEQIKYVYLKGYIVRDKRVLDFQLPLLFLWVDLNGVHYSAQEYYNNSEKFYSTEEEAKSTFMCVEDFDENNNAEDYDYIDYEDVSECMIIKHS